MKLATRIIGVSLLCVVCITYLSGFFAARSSYDEFEHQQRDVANRIAQAMSELIIDAWKTSGPDGVARLIGKGGPARNLGLNVRFVRFTEQAGLSDLPLLPREDWPTGKSDQVESFVTHDEQGQRYLHTYVRLPIADGSAALEFTGSLESLERQNRRTVWLGLLSVGTLAILSILLAYMVGLIWVARPLNQLIAKTQRIGRGDFSEPLRLNTGDELTELAAALNEMCSQLETQQTAIRTESAQRVAALEQLRHADRLKTVGRLAAGIAHELGTPLNVVAGRAALIASGKLSENDVQASARTIKSEADRITSIVSQLLAFARRRAPQRSETDLRALCGKTIELLRPLAEKQRVAIEATADSPPVTALIDASQMQQVLTNLLINAVHAMPGGGEIRVRLSEVPTAELPPGAGPAAESPLTAKARNWAILEVRDQGTGIAAEDLQHIFEPFFTTKDVGEGTGLGLSIALGIVQEHGGRIDVTSEPGQGTCFTVILPLEAGS